MVSDAQKKLSETQDSSQIIKEQEETIQKHNDAIAELKSSLDAAKLKLQSALETRGTLSSRAKDAADAHEQAREMLLNVTEKKFRLATKLDHSETELVNIQNRMWDMYELTYANAQPMESADFDFDASAEEIESVRRTIKNMGTVNVNALEDYTEINERYNEHKVQYDDLIQAESDLLRNNFV